jgi:hypothetical protein
MLYDKIESEIDFKLKTSDYLTLMHVGMKKKSHHHAQLTMFYENEKERMHVYRNFVLCYMDCASNNNVRGLHKFIILHFNWKIMLYFRKSICLHD